MPCEKMGAGCLNVYGRGEQMLAAAIFLERGPYMDLQVKPVRSKDRVKFRCRMCGACCRHVKNAVMLESLDAFRLAKYLRERGDSIADINDVFVQYAEPVPLAEGYPVFTLRVHGAEDACVFLKEGRCGVYEARPRVCRLYPFTVKPGEKGKDFEYLLCVDKPHHFGDGRVLVNDWFHRNFKREDREFVTREFQAALDIGRCLRQLGGSRLDRAMFPLLLYRYDHFDLERPFLPQYDSNQAQLLKILRGLPDRR